MCSHSISRFRLHSDALRTYVRKRPTIGASSTSSIATFCLRTSSSSRSSGPLNASSSMRGREEGSPARVIGRLRPGEEFLAVDPGGGQEFRELFHEIPAVPVEDLETPRTARNGPLPGDR